MTITWNPAAVEAALQDTDGKFFATEGNAYAPNANLQAAVAKLIADGTISVAGDGDYKVPATGTNVEANVAPGYYLGIVKGGEDNVGTVYQNMLINAIPVANSATGVWEKHPDQSITAKSTTVELDKKQKEKGGTEWVATTVEGYKVGDMIPFEITTNIPSYPTNAKVATFEISDTPTGLKIKAPVTVTVGGTSKTASSTVNTAAADETFTVSVTDAGALTIVFDKDFILANPGAQVKVNYSAELVANDNDVGVDTTNNTAKIKYNRNPDEETYYEPPTDIDQKTFNFTFLKYSTDNESTDLASRPGLAGAKFTLWTAATEGTQISLKKDGNVYRPIKEGETGDQYIEVDENGKATIVGLAKTTYYLQEDVAPANYKKADTRIAASANEQTSVVGVDLGVPNQPGTTLPETGGIGTTIFYVAGLVLVLGAAAIIVARRKAEQE